MRILITNAVPLNGGDEALLRAVVETVQRRWPSATVRVLCRQVDLARQQLPDLDLDCDLEEAAPERRHEIAAHYEWADVVVSAPGGFLHDHYEVESRLSGFEVALSLGKPVVVLAQSVGPFWKPKTLERVREVLNRISVLVVRDAVSVRHLGAAGVDPALIRTSGDAAFLWRRLAPELFTRKTGPVRDVAVAFRAWPLGDDDAVAVTVAKAARLCGHLLNDPDRRLTFLSTCQGIEGYHDDSHVAQRVLAALPSDLAARCRIDGRRLAPRALISAYGTYDAYIGMRLHGAVLSMLAGTPALGLGYEEKTAEIFGQLGFGDHQVPSSADVGVWLAATDRFLADIAAIRDRLPAALDELADQAASGVDALASVLPRRGSAQATPRTQRAAEDPAPLSPVAHLMARHRARRVLHVGSGTGDPALRDAEGYYAGADVGPHPPVDFPYYRVATLGQLPTHLTGLDAVVVDRRGLGASAPDELLPEVAARVRPGGLVVLRGGDADVTPASVRRALLESPPVRVEGVGCVGRVRLDAPPTASGRRLAGALPDGAQVVLVGEEWWEPRLLGGHEVRPFLESGGTYYGVPADGEQAVRELRRMSREGGTHLLLRTAGMWWLEHYPELAESLSEHAVEVPTDEHARLFSLSPWWSA